MYSVDTGTFYTNTEKYLHDMNCKYRRERNYIKNKMVFMDQVMKECGFTRSDLDKIKTGHLKNLTYVPGADDLIREYCYWNNLIKHKRFKAKQSKELLLGILKRKVDANIATNGKDHVRVLRTDDLKDNRVISSFESSLTRVIGIEQDELTEALMVVQVYYYSVFEDLIKFGYMHNGEKYIYFTSSAGQIRKKKGVFIKEEVFNKHEKTLMCGLTIDKINAKGGNNVNKHLAYIGLQNSATDWWKDFDIDKCIVIPDMETMVSGVFDCIDIETYGIERRDGSVPIPHMDGGGMVLPKVMSKNAMFRSPWIKGLLMVFDYVKLIQLKGWSPIIKDCWGKEWNVIEDDIQIIFTKSQFKMAKYYDSWQEYKDNFKKYNCQAGLCNIEEDRIKDSKINYQMLQTLTDITEGEIRELADRSVTKITDLSKDKEHMMSALGISPYTHKLTPFQEAVKTYPALLNDAYAKDTLREIKDSLLKKYRSGKLEVKGKYTFVIPDLYAACEYWFGHIENPQGLIEDGEVFCWLSRFADKVDCLRSPHLYKEHAIRKNLAHSSYGDRRDELREWFTTDAIYISTKDLISRILQLDVDGDKLLVVSDKKFVEIAERNMEGIVPLYYDMKKASPTLITPETIYSGLNNAFHYGNIGIYSNNISKIWNSDVFINGTEEEKQEALHCVKLLCCENNFSIDAAKTLFMPTRPDWFCEVVSKFTGSKLPAFFEFAKDKESQQIESRNGTIVNKIFDIVPNKPINTRKAGIEQIDYKKMMANVNMRCSLEIKNLYDELNKKYRYMINLGDNNKIENMRYIELTLRGEFLRTGYSEETITDMLIHYLYGQNKRYKEVLWFCFGRQIVYNLKRNIELIDTRVIQCMDCGEWIEIDVRNRRTCRCQECQNKMKLQLQNDRQRRHRDKN